MNRFNNEACLIANLSERQLDKLIKILPNSRFFWSKSFNKVIGFSKGRSGFWSTNNKELITFNQMIKLIGDCENEY